MGSVRRATPADVDTLAGMMRELHGEAPEYRDEPFDDDVMRRWLAERLATSLMADDSAAFIAEVSGRPAGFVIAIMAPRWFNRLRIGAELTLYVRPAHRGGRSFPRLVEAAKAWAREQGAHKIVFGVSTGIHPERTVHAYRKLGGRLDGYNVTFDL